MRDGIGVGAVMSGAQPFWLGLGQREHGGYFESHGLEKPLLERCEGMIDFPMGEGEKEQLPKDASTHGAHTSGGQLHVREHRE